MNASLTCTVYWILLAAFVLGASPSVPIKSNISTRKTVKVLYKLGTLKSDRPVATAWAETCRVRLRTTAATATYFFCAQALLFSLVLLWTLAYAGSTQVSSSGNFTWKTMEQLMIAFYFWSMVTTTIALVKRQALQRFLDSWLLFSSLGLDFVQEKNANFELSHILDAMSKKISTWSSSKAFCWWMACAFICSAASILSVGLVDSKWAAQSGTAILVVQFRANLGAILYMLVAASGEDKVSYFNNALQEIIPMATPQTVKDLKYFCQSIRNEEKNCQDVLGLSVGICHLQRITCFVFNITNLMFYFRRRSLDTVHIFQSVPMFAYNSLALSIFYALGDRYAVQVNNTKCVLQSTECYNADSEKEITKFHNAVSDPVIFSAGKVASFTIGGGWLDIQFMFTVITVMVQLYESESIMGYA